MKEIVERRGGGDGRESKQRMTNKMDR